jgi:hypothetical protein
VNHTRLIEVKGGQIGCMRKISYNGSLVVALISSMEQLMNLSFLYHLFTFELVNLSFNTVAMIPVIDDISKTQAL